MKKYLMIIAVLIGQVFASADDGVGSEGLAVQPIYTARFVEAGDLEEGAKALSLIQKAVGAIPVDGDVNPKWPGLKGFMAGQIERNAVRRVLVYSGDVPVATLRSGRMPVGFQEAFCDRPESSSDRHNEIRSLVIASSENPANVMELPGRYEPDAGSVVIVAEDFRTLREIVVADSATKGRAEIMLEFYEGLAAACGVPTDRIGVVRDSRPNKPVVLVSNDFHSATLIPNSIVTSEGVTESINIAAVQEAFCALLKSGEYKLDNDSNITGPGKPSVVVTELPNRVDIAVTDNVFVVDLPWYPKATGVHTTLVSVLGGFDRDALAGFLARAKDRVDVYLAGLVG